jgi:hypothetical protein
MIRRIVTFASFPLLSARRSAIFLMPPLAVLSGHGAGQKNKNIPLHEHKRFGFIDLR